MSATIMTADCSKDVSRILSGCADEMTSGEVLRLMIHAWNAGYRAGFGDGLLAGQTQAAVAQDMIAKAMER